MQGLFVKDRLVVFVTIYNKTIEISTKAKVIHRYLLHKVGKLAIYYIQLAIPFQQLVVQGASQGRADRGSVYIQKLQADKAQLFPRAKGRGSSSSKRKQIARYNTARKRGVQPVQQQLLLSLQLSKAGRDRVIKGRGKDRDSYTERGNKQQQLDLQDTNYISQQISKVLLQYIGKQLRIILQRYSVKAIYWRYIRNKAVIDIINNVDTAEGKEEEQDRAGQGVRDAFYRQSRYRARIGEGIYRRSTDKSLFSTEAQRIGFQQVSRKQHAFCIFNSVLQEGSSGSGAKASRLADVVQQATKEESQRQKIMQQVDARAQLRKMLGPEARFQGVQEAALGAIMQQESLVVVVIGTGGGKSMLFILLAVYRTVAGGLTVVVVLLVLLQGNIKDQCNKLGIEYIEQSSRQLYKQALVVLVTLEAAVRESFRYFVNQQQAIGQLDWIVVDKCYIVLDLEARGRQQLQVLGLRRLVKAETQLVYLIATLQLADKAKFRQLVRLLGKGRGRGRGRGIKWFQSATIYRNVQYQVQQYNR